MSDIVADLLALSRAEHDDLSVAGDGAAEIERLRLLMAERDQFIVERGLWAEFLKEFGSHKCYGSEQVSTIGETGDK